MRTLITLIWSLTINPTEAPEQKLSSEAMATILYTQSGDSTNLASVLTQHKGQVIFIDFWASWCKDCIVGFPKVKQLQSDFPNTKFLFLSVDLKNAEWLRGIERFGLTGSHLRINDGWKSPLCTSVDLDWIPRYMIVDSDGNILHFKSILAEDENLTSKLTELTN